MPVLFEYLGIVIKFYSNEHEPVHVHALYGDAEIKISFFIKEGDIYKTTYVCKHGKFPQTRLRLLKEFINVYRSDIVKLWSEYFIWHKPVKPKIINKKI